MATVLMNLTPEIVAEAKAATVAHAEAAHSKWAQYRGHWNDWKAVRVVRRVRTKMGVAFERGDVSVGRLDTIPTADGDVDVVIVYSLRNRIDTAVGLNEVQWLE